MTWLPILALAGLSFLLAAYLLKLPKQGFALFGAALLFGLAGYALQGNPGQAGSPKSAVEEANRTGELVVEARREFFDPNVLPSRFVVTSDAFARRGDFENAARFLRNAVETDPEDAEAWIALGNALVEHADGQLTSAALFAYSRAEQLQPESPAAGYFVGLGMLRSGQPGRARAIWSELVENAPEGAEWLPALEMRLERLDSILAQGAMQ